MHTFLLKFLTIFLILTVSGCQTDEPYDEAIRPVRTLTVPEAGQTLTRVFPARISPAHEVNLSFRVSNTVTEFPVKKGQHVKSGDRIAMLDPRDFEIAIRNISGNLDEAKANLKAMLTGSRTEDVLALESRLSAARTVQEEAILQYQRYEKLFEMNAIAASALDSARSKKEEAISATRFLEMELEKAVTGSREEDIEAMRARISSLEAQLDKARSALDDTLLRAPFDGYVAEKYVDNHENVSAGQPVVRFQNMSRLEAAVGIPEQLMIQKDLIRSIHVRLETFPEHFFPARIKEISTDASATGMTYRLTTIMDRPLDIPVYPSMAADVYIAFAGQKQGFITVPETAIIFREGDGDLLWIFDSDTETVRPRKVTPGQITSRGIEVLDGIQPGEVIVIAGADFLKEGQKVRVVHDGESVNQ